MENLNIGPAEQRAASTAPRRFGGAKRVAATIAASAVLLGSGAAIGIAVTGGASASTGGSASAASSTARHRAGIAAKCAKIAAELSDSGHPVAAKRLHAFCTMPLVRLMLVGGEYGQVTFKGKTGPRTIAFERGTVESVAGSAITVEAPDGTAFTWDLTASTIVRAAGQGTVQAKPADGDRVLVGGLLANGVRDARLIRIGRQLTGS
jgi:hypothetical protein